MPNVGRPSRGCKNCRDRKVKCDLKRPSCSQCIRTGKVCHGYRDPLAMMFKNESEVVAKKAEKRYQALSKQKSRDPAPAVHQENKYPDSDSSATSSSSDESYSPQNEQQLVTARPWTLDNVTLQMVPSIEDQAVGFFFSKYVLEPAAVPRGTFEWLSELLNRPDTEKILQTSVEAASLAGLANSTKNPFIMKRAQSAYGSALSMTNQALQFTETAKRDSTLIAVIMLGMFENFAFQDKNSLKAWARHVNGACALLKLRGKDQFQNSIAHRVFIQFYGTILLVSLELRQPIPEGIADLWEVASGMGDYSVQGRQWTTRLVRFMHSAIDLTQDKTTDPMSMVKRGMNLNRELDSIKALIPNIWKYETVFLEKPEKSVYGNQYHIYLDPWISQMWNNLRSCRICLHRVLREQLEKGAILYPAMFPVSEVQVQIEASNEVIRATSAGVCASTAQITGQIPFPDTKNPGPSSSFSDFAHPDDPKYKLHPQGTFLDPFKPTGMMHLIWPLYAVGESDLASNELRQWAIEQLYFVAHAIGTRQAVVLAEDLKRLQRSGSVNEVPNDPDDIFNMLLLPV